MAGNTLFRPEDRLAWYADWLKFLQEREAELRTQLARQEKSARKVEAPPEAGIAFVSDQPASFLQIAFGEQATNASGQHQAAIVESSSSAPSEAVVSAPVEPTAEEAGEEDLSIEAEAEQPGEEVPVVTTGLAEEEPPPPILMVEDLA